MRFQGYRKWLAAMVSVSCFAGSGPFCVNGAEIRQEDAGAVSAESESELRHTHINWWICPTGGFSDKERVQLLVDEFEEAYPQIDVDYRILDEVTGPGEIRTALERRLPEAGEASDAGDLSDEGKPDSKDFPRRKESHLTGRRCPARRIPLMSSLPPRSILSLSGEGKA